MSSRGYLQLNPMEEIPGHAGMFAQFKSSKSRRARAVAAGAPEALRKTPKKKQGKKPGGKYAALSARERSSIMRRLMKI
jgi:hypothetical protein